MCRGLVNTEHDDQPGFDRIFLITTHLVEGDGISQNCDRGAGLVDMLDRCVGDCDTEAVDIKPCRKFRFAVDQALDVGFLGVSFFDKGSSHLLKDLLCVLRVKIDENQICLEFFPDHVLSPFLFLFPFFSYSCFFCCVFYCSFSFFSFSFFPACAFSCCLFPLF